MLSPMRVATTPPALPDTPERPGTFVVSTTGWVECEGARQTPSEPADG